MTVAQLTHTDKHIRDAVIQQLEWDPAVEASAIAVAARDGVVMLTGNVNTYAEKLAAERIAKGVRGVRAVANEIEVRPMFEYLDADIAADAARALELRGTVPLNVQVVVHNGRITLTGRVARMFHKTEAEKAVRRLKGVRGVFNHIEIAPGVTVGDLQKRIVDALHRDADLDASNIFVSVDGTTVRLSGTVPTWAQRDAAERAAASAPAITWVDNRIVVEPAIEAIDELC
jgi:osmotically-inducible protein OsmY